MWVRGHSRSLKESFGTVSFSPSIVTMAVSAAISQIFSVKEWPDLEIWVWGPSWSLRMVRFDRPCMTFYWSAIVTIALSCTVVKVENQRWGNCTSALGPQTGGCGLMSVCMKFEVWERWLPIIGGAGTAFLCVQWHFNHWSCTICKLFDAE